AEAAGEWAAQPAEASAPGRVGGLRIRVAGGFSPTGRGALHDGTSHTPRPVARGAGRRFLPSPA
ncbi:MAG: hypothetical protein ACUVS4_13430, partial [Chloroflexaceae bacterium]